jgi:hypothetical protein
MQNQKPKRQNNSTDSGVAMTAMLGGLPLGQETPHTASKHNMMMNQPPYTQSLSAARANGVGQWKCVEWGQLELVKRRYTPGWLFLQHVDDQRPGRNLKALLSDLGT